MFESVLPFSFVFVVRKYGADSDGGWVSKLYAIQIIFASTDDLFLYFLTFLRAETQYGKVLWVFFYICNGFFIRYLEYMTVKCFLRWWVMLFLIGLKISMLGYSENWGLFAWVGSSAQVWFSWWKVNVFDAVWEQFWAISSVNSRQNHAFLANLEQQKNIYEAI